MSCEPRRSLWGLGAGLLYGGFVIFILSMVLYASVQHFQLSETGYYEQGLDYQEQINRIKRSQSLSQPLEIEHQYSEEQVLLTFPQTDSTVQIDGEVRMLRPSNARLDRRWPVAPDMSGRQVIATAGMQRGQWRIEVDWRMDSSSYYNESRIVVP